MNLIQRVQDILLKPKETWPTIAQEPATVASIYQTCLIYLAAIPAIAAFIGLSLIGVGGFGFGFRVPILTGLVHMVVGYVLSLVMVFVLALIVDALAPTFGGTKNQIAALKVVAYGSDGRHGRRHLQPAARAVHPRPDRSALLDLPDLHRPADADALPAREGRRYTAVVIVCGIVLSILIGVISGLLLPSRMGMGMGGLGGRHGDVTISTPTAT